MMGYEGGDLLLAGAALAVSGRCAEPVDAGSAARSLWTARSLWMQAVGSDLTVLAAQFQWRKHVRDAYTRYALYKWTPLPFYHVIHPDLLTHLTHEPLAHALSALRREIIYKWYKWSHSSTPDWTTAIMCLLVSQLTSYGDYSLFLTQQHGLSSISGAPITSVMC